MSNGRNHEGQEINAGLVFHQISQLEERVKALTEESNDTRMILVRMEQKVDTAMQQRGAECKEHTKRTDKLELEQAALKDRVQNINNKFYAFGGGTTVVLFLLAIFGDWIKQQIGLK